VQHALAADGPAQPVAVLDPQQPPGPHRDDGLARVLGCAPAALVLLRLCRRPGSAEPLRLTKEDIEVIARRFAINAAALRRLLAEGGQAP
jgi:hypothetical protein